MLGGTGESSGASPARSLQAPGGWSSLPAPADFWYERAYPALAFSATLGLGVMYGGVLNGTVLNQTWVNDGDEPGNWVPFSSGLNASPPALQGASLAYDSVRDYFLLFGGTLANGTLYGGTWTFSNFHWVDLTGSLSLAPPPQASAPMTFDSEDGYVLLVSSVGADRTWSFDGKAWTMWPTTSAPPPSSGGVIVDAPSLGEVVLFGGYDPTGATARTGGTWAYGNGTWSPAATGTSPGSPRGATGCYDPRLGGVLLFDGNGVGETWSFGPAGWVLEQGPSLGGPPAGLGETVYFDTILGYDVLFGGTGTGSSVLSPSVWGWGVPPPYRDPTLTPTALPPQTFLEVGLVAAVPILVVLLLRRRPPRPSVTTVPRPTSSGA